MKFEMMEENLAFLIESIAFMMRNEGNLKFSNKWGLNKLSIPSPKAHEPPGPKVRPGP